MANRPVFYTEAEKRYSKTIEFKWIPGMALSQKQKCIESLHRAACAQIGVSQEKILEISTKSRAREGVLASAFNLKMNYKGKERSIETIFHSCKVFEGDCVKSENILEMDSYRAKKAIKEYSQYNLKKFVYSPCETCPTVDWKLEPKTAFYDWLYIKAILANTQIADAICKYKAFTDIEFNPTHSVNCQAFAAALYCVLRNKYDNATIESILCCQNNFIESYNEFTNKETTCRTGSLFDKAK